jgi:hypothetical protein
VHTVHYRALIPILCAEYMPVLSVSELETNHSTDSDWARVAGAGPAGREADGSRGMDGPCRSCGPNQKESEPIRDSAPCPSRDGGGGPPRPRSEGCWPAPVPDSDGVSRRHCGPTVMQTCCSLAGNLRLGQLPLAVDQRCATQTAGLKLPYRRLQSQPASCFRPAVAGPASDLQLLLAATDRLWSRVSIQSIAVSAAKRKDDSQS